MAVNFNDCTFRKAEDYIRDKATLVDLRSYGPTRNVELINYQFCGGRWKNRDRLPLPNATPEVACDDFVDFVTSRYFPCDGSWITFSLSEEMEMKQKEIKLLHLLRSRLADTNFYQQMNHFIKSGVLFNTAIMTCNWLFKSLSFSVFSIFDDRGTTVRMVGDNAEVYMRGYIDAHRNLAALLTHYDIPDYSIDTGKRTIEVLGQGNASQYQTTQCFLPLTDDFVIVNGKKEDHDKFFMIELDAQGQNILKPKDNILPTYTVFPIFIFRPALSRSMGEKAVGPAYELLNTVYELRKRIKYTNNPTKVMSENTIAKFKDLKQNIEDVFNKPGQVLPVDGTSDIEPKGLKLENDLPIDMQYIQKYEHDIRMIFKADLIERSKIVGLSAPEEAQRQLGIHNEVAPFLGSVLTRTAKNMLMRVDTILRQEDAEYKKLAEGVAPTIITNSYLQSIQKYARLKDATTLAEFASALSGMDQSVPAEHFKADALLRNVAGLLEHPEAVAGENEVLEQRKGYEQMSGVQQQAEAEGAKAQKDIADANLKNQQAEAATLQGGF